MNIGDKTPEILGKDEQGRDIRLSDYKGRKLVLSTSPTTDKFLMISGGQKRGGGGITNERWRSVVGTATFLYPPSQSLYQSF